MSVLDEVKAAEEKAAAQKEKAKADTAIAIKEAEKKAIAESDEIIASARKKATCIINDGQMIVKKASEKSEADLEKDKKKLSAVADSNSAEAADFVLSLF